MVRLFRFMSYELVVLSLEDSEGQGSLVCCVHVAVKSRT